MKNEYEIRTDKLNKLIALGVNPYPSKVNIDKSLAEVRSLGSGFKDELSIAGRIMSIRGHGGSAFMTLKDESGELQIFLKKDVLGEENYSLVSLLDRGDFIQVTGQLFETKAGELTLEAKNFIILSKALRPLPEKRLGLKEKELRFRKRYLDLLTNKKVRERFIKRSEIIKTVRGFLNNKGFLEVDTPVLQAIPGGATARPFKTYYNFYHRDVFLRIAPELYLKRLIVGGFEKVFEFARCFRNECADATHNPEFTNLEFYWAYADYEKLMELTEELLSKIDPEEFSPPFKRMTFEEITQGKNTDDALKEEEKKIVEPTFIIDHPKEISPLAKGKEDDPTKVQRFQVVFRGLEIVNAYSELNDPVEQAKRFAEQKKMIEKGDKEAHPTDTDFVEALEYGMPPTAGWGMGIDRVTALLTGAETLREAILFPYMKPIEKNKKNNNIDDFIHRDGNTSEVDE